MNEDYLKMRANINEHRYRNRRPTQEEWREAASKIYDDPGLKIPSHGVVQEVEGGAFVEATVWVPIQSMQAPIPDPNPTPQGPSKVVRDPMQRLREIMERKEVSKETP